MKKLLSVFLCFLTFSITVKTQEFEKVRLPLAAKKVLDNKYPDWKFAKVADEVRAYYKKTDAEMNLVRGDFDGNGQMDYALKISYGVEFTGGGTAHPKSHFVALLQNAGKYKIYIVDAEAVGDFLTVWKKGDRGYNYETQKHFVFANDAVEAIIFEKAGVSYVFEKGKFRAIMTGD